MESQGYIAETVVTAPHNLANDYIFVKKELLKISWKHQQWSFFQEMQISGEKISNSYLFYRHPLKIHERI